MPGKVGGGRVGTFARWGTLASLLRGASLRPVRRCLEAGVLPAGSNCCVACCPGMRFWARCSAGIDFDRRPRTARTGWAADSTAMLLRKDKEA